MKPEESLVSEISMEKVNEAMEYLVNEVGERLSGTEKMRSAADYICNRLQKYGLDAWVDHFPMYMSYPGDAALKVIAPIEIEYKACPVCHILNTGDEGVEGELLYLGSGGYADYKGKDPRGKIILTDMTWSPGRPEKARSAWELGAKALIIMNWGKAENKIIQMGAVKHQWGNPTPQTESEIVQIPVISISRADGEALAALSKRESVKVWLKASATREWITADQTTAFVKGGKSNGQFVVVGSHVDAWGKSAICNASGDSVNMELARLFYNQRADLKRDVYFCFWDGHEIAECGGSTWFCDQHWPELDKNCLAYINIDNIAIKDTSIPGVESLPELKGFLMDAIKEIWGEVGLWHHAYKGGGDSSFFGVGVPYISFATEYTDKQLVDLNHAFYGPFLHSDADTIDKLDQDLLYKHLLYDLHILFQLVDRDLIPYNIAAMAEEITQQYDKLLGSAGRAEKWILFLRPALDAYRIAVGEVHEKTVLAEKGGITSHEIEILNQVMLRFGRSTAIFRSEAGRYGQDGCCYLQTERPIPALEKALRKYNAAQEGSHTYYLMETEIMRIANRVYDTLAVPTEYWNAVLKAL